MSLGLCVFVLGVFAPLGLASLLLDAFIQHNDDIHSELKAFNDVLCSSDDAYLKNNNRLCYDPATVTMREITALAAKAADKILHPNEATKNAKKTKKQQSLGKTNSQLPYFRFIPKYIGPLMKVNETVSFDGSPCYGTLTARRMPEINVTGLGQQIPLEVVGTNKANQDCYSRVWFTIGYASTTAMVQFADKTTSAFVNITSFDATARWDLEAHGVRVYLFNDTHFEMYSDILTTALLFLPNIIGQPPDPMIAAMNMEFFNRFTGIEPRFKPRTMNNYTGSTGGLLPGFDESLVESGDTMFVASMEGMSLVIGVGAGTTAGHSVIFLRNESSPLRELFVCESTDPMVQCTPFREWVAHVGGRQGANLVWLPLSPEYRRKLNVTKAWEFVESQLGFSYGFNTFVFGWVDTLADNYPCMPPDFNSRCLVWQHVEWFALWFERLLPSLINRVVGQALGNRLNVSFATLPNTSVASLFMLSETQFNISSNRLSTLPEKDSYRYYTTRYGKPAIGRAMVCSTFVCNVMKHAGVLSSIDGDIECGEQTPWNLGAMMIYDSTKFYNGRPELCRRADPANRLCQLSGDVEFNLEVGVNSMPLYRQMGDYCQSKNPDYTHKEGC